MLTRVMDGVDLSSDEAATAMRAILTGNATSAQLIGFTVALRIKGETSDELSGMLDAVLGAVEVVPLSDVVSSGSAVDPRSGIGQESGPPVSQRDA